MIILVNVFEYIERKNADYVFHDSFSQLETDGAMVVSAHGNNSNAAARWPKIKHLYTAEEINKMKDVFSNVFYSNGDENGSFKFIGIK